jgi:hypothetical protein
MLILHFLIIFYAVKTVFEMCKGVKGGKTKEYYIVLNLIVLILIIEISLSRIHLEDYTHEK